MYFAFFFLTPLLFIDYMDFSSKSEADFRKKTENFYFQHHNNDFYPLKTKDGNILILDRHNFTLYNPLNYTANHYNAKYTECSTSKAQQIDNDLFLLLFENCASQIWHKGNNTYENAFNIENLENPILLNRANQDWTIIYNTNHNGGILTHIGLWNPERKIYNTVTLPHYLSHYTAILLDTDNILIAGGQETLDTVELDMDCLPTCQATFVGIFNEDYWPESANNFAYIFNLTTKTIRKTAISSEKLGFSYHDTIVLKEKNHISFLVLDNNIKLHYIHSYNTTKDSWYHGKEFTNLLAPFNLENKSIIILKDHRVLASYNLLPKYKANFCLPSNYVDTKNEHEICEDFINYPKTIIDNHQIIRIGGIYRKNNNSLIKHYQLNKNSVKKPFYPQYFWQRLVDYYQALYIKFINNV